MATVIAVVGGWAWSQADSRGGAVEDDQVVLDKPGVYDEPSIATNAPVAGRQLPEVVVETVGGDAISTRDLIGAPLVINIWFTTCPPCRREMPALAAVHAEYGDRVRFVGINPRDDGPAAASFAEARGVRYENYLDRNGEFLAAAGIGTFPSTLLVTADGTIVRLRAGEVDQPTLASLIEQELLS